MLELTSPRVSKTTTGLLLGALSLLLAMSVPVFAQGPERSDSAHEMKVPETAKDHYEMAAHYQKIETQTHQEVEMHKKMLTEFSRGVAKGPKDPNENPYIKKMRLHCEEYIKAAESLAREAGESARFHTLRAKELEGK